MFARWIFFYRFKLKNNKKNPMGKCDSCYLFAANESTFSIAKRLDLHARRNQILLQTQPCSDAHCNIQSMNTLVRGDTVKTRN